MTAVVPPEAQEEERPLINWPAIQHAQLLAQNEEGVSTSLSDAVNALAVLVHRLELYADSLRVRCDQQERALKTLRLHISGASLMSDARPANLLAMIDAALSLAETESGDG